MSKTTYAQTICRRVELIGGEEIGLPLNENYLERNKNVLNIDITDLEIKPKIGWFYIDGVFYEVDPRPITTFPSSVTVLSEPTNSELMQTVNDLRAELEIAGVIL